MLLSSPLQRSRPRIARKPEVWPIKLYFHAPHRPAAMRGNDQLPFVCFRISADQNHEHVRRVQLLGISSVLQPVCRVSVEVLAIVEQPGYTRHPVVPRLDVPNHAIKRRRSVDCSQQLPDAFLVVPVRR